MRALGLVAVVAVGLSAAACQTTQGGADAGPPCAERPIADWVEGAGVCLSLATFGAKATGSQPDLVVVLHGDVSRGGAADYHVPIAQEIAERSGVIAVALVRPGYPDGRGGSSGGSHNSRRDHYTDTNNRIVGEAIAALKRAYAPRRTVILAHSGGAAQAGVALGRFPDLADAALLVSCPCDVPRWRRMRNRSAWTQSQSPHSFIDQVAAGATVIAMTGANDGNTDFSLAVDYAAALSARGVAAQAIEVPGESHGFTGLWPSVRAQLFAYLDRPAGG